MEIIIIRQEHKPWGIDGHLYINRKRICDTVEHPTRHKPNGTYSTVSTNASKRPGNVTPPSTSPSVDDYQSEPTSYSCEFVFYAFLFKTDPFSCNMQK